MLQFVLGRNYADKTEYLRNLAAEKIKNSDEKVIFIIPEQFSYETEKSMLEKVGANGMQRLEVLSLTRLAELCFEQSGGENTKQKVDSGVRMLTMSLALEGLSDSLEIFGGYIDRPVLVESLVSFATELKQCSVTTQMLDGYAEGAEESSLKAKVSELSRIIALYNAMLERDYYDPEDSLTKLTELLCDYPYLKDKTVFIDAFTRFTKQEMGVIEQIVAQSPEVYISFVTDSSFDDDFSIFKNINSQMQYIKRIASNYGSVTVNEPVTLKEDENAIDKNLLTLERNIFLPEKESTEDVPENIHLLCANDKSDECNFVALCIKKLLREEKARGRDIVVYQRDNNAYDDDLAFAFSKYGIPYFEDKRQPLESQPLIVYIRALLKVCAEGLSTDTVLRYLKTGLTDIEPDDIAMLENYAYIWQLKPSQWKNVFSDNPKGFGTEIKDKEEKQLNKLNKIREKTVGPLLAFCKKFNEASGQEKTKVLFEFLKNSSLRDKLYQNAIQLSDDGLEYLYEEQDAVWSLVMNMLDRMYLATADSELNAKRYAGLFDLLLSVSDLGTLPQGLDCVAVAGAERSRIGVKKYTFAVGANEGEFPKTPQTQGLLNDKDRKLLREFGIELAETAEYKQTEEKFIAYKAVCSASHGVYISHCNQGLRGEAYSPSEIIREIKGIFKNIKEEIFEELPDEEKVESAASAFEVFARDYNEDTPVESALYELLSENPEYDGRLKALDRAANKRQQRIVTPGLSEKLFGKDLYFSASKAEVYRDCPFKFFCKHGIKAEAREKADVSASVTGLVLHEIFENVLQKHSKQELEQMNDRQLEMAVGEILKDYLNVKMGGEQNKTVRFLKQYNSLRDRATSILKRIIEEFKTCDFYPVDFELRIGKSDNDSETIQEYCIPLTEGELKINGSVDRVDLMKKDGKSYIRVVDYKSGGKEFKIGDVFYGMSMQMLIYLFAIYTGGRKKYGEVVPCGIFYMPGKLEAPSLPRDATPEQIDKERLKKNKMSGIVVEDIDIIKAMENNMGKLFINAGVDRNGNLTGDVVPYKDLMLLKREVDSLLKETGELLHGGDIRVLPFDPDHSCKYCDYKAVCGYEEGDPKVDYVKRNHKEAVKYLEEKYAAEEGDNG